ncbi:aminoglycoside phosphotransferase family protein [Thalassovita taeanensis]|uniref:Predicted kinase, aminoglycoside phosphotransferase (APT) family n=1 Tax=Thalassovita taeanensis TaxID=657014 RepID=A0A1H9I9J3_9RHOB|nr:aminoglycoside phosphotransferase family protein [Thalassovita taeanensis]SEQ71237.1 Predicted kinase, aminoglycoside phosphotransferase (APT) family [Thalassovita taeanensis]
MIRPDHGLVTELTRLGQVPAGLEWHSLKGGQTNQLWQVGQGPRSLVVKLFAPADGNPLFPNDAAHETLLLQYLDGMGLAPALQCRLQTDFGVCIIYRHHTGQCWTTGTPAVAHVLRRVHSLAVPKGLRLACDGSEHLRNQAEHILSRLPASVAQPLMRLRPKGTVAPSGRVALLHGDPVPGNLIQNQTGLILIDWQCPALGDPVEDLAIFLSPAMQKIYRGHVLTRAEIADFLSAYDDPEISARLRALAPWHHWRMAAYCAWKAQQGAAGYAKAIELERAALV